MGRLKTGNRERDPAPHKQIKQKMKQIIVGYGVVKQLENELHTSRVTVGAALRLRTNTELARKIRQRALQLGGVVMEAEKVNTVPAQQKMEA